MIKETDLWKSERRDYSNVMLSHLREQTNYMQHIGENNVNKFEDNQDTKDFQYWAAFTDILTTFNEGVNSGYSLSCKLERARMAGMIDAFNIIIKGIEQGEFME